MFDDLMWWTGLIVWLTVGTCGIALGGTLAALWTVAYVGHRARIVSDFIRWRRTKSTN